LTAVPQQRHLRVDLDDPLAVEAEEVELGGGGEDAPRHDGHGAGDGDAEDRRSPAEDERGGDLAAGEGGDDDVLGDPADDRGGRDLEQREGRRAEHGEDEPALLLPRALQQALQPGDEDGGVLRGGHAITKCTMTAIAKVNVDSTARENSMRIPVPRAFSAIHVLSRPFLQSFSRSDSATYRPARNPIGSPRKGMTKKPTTAAAIAT